MTLSPDRTCRLKFPVVAEELIEYSGARHGECSLGRENFRRHRHRKVRARERASRQMATSLFFFFFFTSENFRPRSVSPTYYCSSLASRLCLLIFLEIAVVASSRLRRLEIIHKKSSPREYQSRSRKRLPERSFDIQLFARRNFFKEERDFSIAR